MSNVLRGCAWGALMMLAACSGDKPPPKPQPQPTQQAVVPAPEPDPEPAGDGGAGGGSAQGGEQAAPQPAPRKSAGRPAVLMGPSESIVSTFGATPASILKLKGKGGSITLKLPEFSLRRPANIVWKLLKKRVKTKGTVVGSLVELNMTRAGKPGMHRFNADEGKFELRWPLGNEPSLNLAIGTAEVGADGRAGAISWQVIAPTNVDTGFKEAYFHVTTLGPMQYYYATRAEPTEPAAAAP